MPISTISQAGLDAPISLTSPTLTTPNINSAQIATVSGTAPLYMCRAWVNFNGTGTVAIRASGNVTSITDNGVGLYTVNFTTAMPDINYSPVVVASPIYAGGSSFVNLYSNSATTEVAPTTSAFNLRCGYSSSGVTEDLKYVCIAIFR